MSYENFITNLLNIKPSDLSNISTATKSDGSLIINIKLLPKPIVCPYCSGKVIIQCYYKRKLTSLHLRQPQLLYRIQSA